MGTSWSARIVDPPEGCEAAILATLARITAQMSNWEAESDISRFNSTSIDHWITLPPDMLTVLRAGLEMARLSSGAFDPAIGHLVDHWGFGPSARSVVPVITTMPWQAIELTGDTARRRADVALDFSGIAKGFAVDALADTLRALGADNFLIEIGGELHGQGGKPDMQPWWVDVEVPTDLSVPILRIALCDLSVATSGDYRRYRMEGAQRQSHSINPATQSPIGEGVASVTVLHESAMMADAWATAITVLGPDRGMALATRHGLAARLVMRDGGQGMEYMTPALAAMLD